MNFINYLKHVILPILFGGIIYVCFRTKRLILFDWLDFVGLNQIVDIIRDYSTPIAAYLPEQFIYSLPAGLWLYSFISFNILTWKKVNNGIRILWFWIPIIISILSEIFQYNGLLRGTYSNTDIVYYVFFAILSYVNLMRKKNEKFKT